MALTKPFAENGDKKTIPENTTGDGSLSYETGFGGFYALPPEEGGLYIDRAQFNQLMYDTTSQVLANKTAIATKANANATVNLTDDQTIEGVKTFSMVPIVATQPTDDNEIANKAYVDSVVNVKANANAVVALTGNQTIAGTKTFSSPVVVPNATANTHAVNLAQLNTKANQATTYTKTEVNNLVNAKANANATVNLTGNQTIAGVKTFSAVPVVATQPTNANQVANKAYVDSRLGKAYITETYTKGKSWYRVWSDKWCEQGGHCTGSAFYTVTFLKPFSNTNYNPTVTFNYSHAGTIMNMGCTNLTTTSMEINTGDNAQGNNRPVYWQARGYIA